MIPIGPYNDATRSVLRAGNTLLEPELYSGLYSGPLLCGTPAGQVSLSVLGKKYSEKSKKGVGKTKKKKKKSTNRKKDNKCEKRQKGESETPKPQNGYIRGI